jgi:hypothetical protein
MRYAGDLVELRGVPTFPIFNDLGWLTVTVRPIDLIRVSLDVG